MAQNYTNSGDVNILEEIQKKLGDNIGKGLENQNEKNSNGSGSAKLSAQS